MAVERTLDPLNRHMRREPRRGVDVWANPHRCHPREHHAQQQRSVQRSGHHHLVAGTTQRQHQRLVAVRRTADRDAAPGGAPCSGQPTICFCDDASLLPDRVDSPVQRDVVSHDRPDQIDPLLVSGGAKRHRMHRPIRQPAVQQWSVTAQTERVVTEVSVVAHGSDCSDRRDPDDPGAPYAPGVASVVVIGAGMGGLAVAARLAAQGHEVTVIEQSGRPGGKVATYRRDGFAFDTGPSLLTLPAVYRDLFLKTPVRRKGASLEENVDLRGLEQAFGYRWSDGTTVALPGSNSNRVASALGAALGGTAEADWQGFSRRAADIWAVTRVPFLETPVSGLRDLAR